MTEMLFTASVVFVGYAIYTLVEEQVSCVNVGNHPVQPRTRVAVNSGNSKLPAPSKKQPARSRKKVKTKVIDLPGSVGKTAGKIWNYLSDNGSASVVKLMKAMPDDNKTLQRSIGWLAQEGRITLETIGRVETISLKP